MSLLLVLCDYSVVIPGAARELLDPSVAINTANISSKTDIGVIGAERNPKKRCQCIANINSSANSNCTTTTTTTASQSTSTCIKEESRMY